MNDPDCQLYLVSPPALGDGFADRLERALSAGPVAAFQLRMKEAPDDAIIVAAGQLMPICAAHDCAFILNDRADLAKQLGAEGVHLGRSDGSIKEARALLGPSAQIGATCHDSRHFAMEAGEAGADYVAFGAFYPTQTKETEYRPEPEILRWWSSLFEIPCVAIGGITADNAPPLVEAGADFLAVSSAVWNHPDGETAGVQAFSDLLGSR
ncbi:MAG: thiamine phosphate synthase [Sphingomonadaceae bacterium]|nr:thiamine phosphate synthase [Sphingomonadaceae bacterium]